MILRTYKGRKNSKLSRENVLLNNFLGLGNKTKNGKNHYF